MFIIGEDRKNQAIGQINAINIMPYKKQLYVIQVCKMV